MVAACITLCNSACITCIWCFLLSICFPKFVQSMEEAESSECCARKFRNHRQFSGSVGDREGRKQSLGKYHHEPDIVKRRNSRPAHATSPTGSRDPVNGGHRRSKEVEILHPESLAALRESFSSLNDTPPDSAIIIDNNDRDSRYNDPEVQKKVFANRLTRSPRSNNRECPGRRYKLYAKLSRVASGLEERFLDRKQQQPREFSCDKPMRCFHECENYEKSRYRPNM